MLALLSPGRLMTLASRARRQPTHILARKTLRFGGLLLHHWLHLWDRYERKAQRRWSDRGRGAIRAGHTSSAAAP